MATCCRNSLNAQIAQERARFESEQSSHTTLQQKLSELEKEKMLIDLELKDTSTRYKTEISRRDATISNVGCLCSSFQQATYFFCIFMYILVFM